MADLFLEVLARKDLSRAGDLFLVDNESILSQLGTIIEQIHEIISAGDYVHSDNNQSVVEISITRVTSAIRSAKDDASGMLDMHLFALVSLLEVCLLHDLKPNTRGENPPHAKIASDVISCLFLHHGKRQLMKRVLPVGVKFLHKGNRELSRTLSSYLALSAVESADLLAPSVQPLIDSVISGNFFLARVLPQIYSVNPEPVHDHVMALVSLIPACESPERLALLTLFHSIAAWKPLLLESSLPQLCEGLSDPATVLLTLQVFLRMAQARPSPFAEYLLRLKGIVASSENKEGLLVVIQIVAAVGRMKKEGASGAIAFILDHLPLVSTSDLQVPLRELTILCDSYPALLTEKLIDEVHRCTVDCPPSAKAYLLHLNNEFNTIRSPPVVVSQSHGGVTIVRVSSSGGGIEGMSNAPLSRNGAGSSVVGGTSTGVSTIAVGASPVPTGGGRMKLGEGNSKSTGRLPLLGLAPSGKSTGTTAEVLHARTKPTGLYQSSRELQVSSPFLPSTTNKPSAHPPMYKSLSALVSSARPLPSLSQTALVLGCNPGGVGTSTGGSSREDAVSGPPVASSPLSPPQCLPVNVVSQSSQAQPPSTPPSLSVPFSLPPSSVYLRNAGTRSPLTVLSQTSGTRPLVQEINKTPWSKHHGGQNIYSPNAPDSGGVIIRPKTRDLHSPTANVVNSNGGTTPIGLMPTTGPPAGMNVGSGAVKSMPPYQRISVFEPSPMRDTVQQFCEKHLEKIKAYMERIFVSLPLPVRCTIEERKNKKHAKLSFACKGKGEHCLYNRTFFNVTTKHPRVWMHLMFLALQARSPAALSTRENSVASLRNCWDTLKCENKSFVALVTSAFPNAKEQDLLMTELRESGFFDVFEYNGLLNLWGCFLCNHPERAAGYLQPDRPVIEGRLKGKKGRWKAFRRWRSRYFTLTGVHLSYRGSRPDKDPTALDVGQIRSVKTIGSRRSIPKAFEIFTNDDTSLVLKPEDGKNLEEWVQCLSIAVAHCQAKADSHTKTLTVWGSGSLR